MLDLTPGLIAILVACALMCGLAKTALPGLACIPVAILAAVMPTRPSTALMLLMLLTGDLLARPVSTGSRGGSYRRSFSGKSL